MLILYTLTCIINKPIEANITKNNALENPINLSIFELYIVNSLRYSNK